MIELGIGVVLGLVGGYLLKDRLRGFGTMAKSLLDKFVQADKEN